MDEKPITYYMLNETGIIKPGADSFTLSNSVKDTVLTLGNNDVLVFSGGANDISKNNFLNGTKTHFKFC
jgi:hypothetical protein